MCEKMKSIINIEAISHKFLAHVANIVSIALPVFKTSTTAMLSQKKLVFYLQPNDWPNVCYNHYIENF